MLFIVCISLLVPSVLGVANRAGEERARALATTWDKLLDGDRAPAPAPAGATPVTRVVELLKEMSTTLQKDMDEDEEIYGKQECWCKENAAGKKAAIKANTEKVAELESTIEELTASSASLELKIKELEEEVADNKQTLAKATALREKESAQFTQDERDAIEAISNLNAAITALSKHHAAALPQLGVVSLLESGSRKRVESGSRKRKDDPWGLESKDQRDLDMFMGNNGFSSASSDETPQKTHAPTADKFLQQPPSEQPKVEREPLPDDWSVHDTAVVQVALSTARSFVQRRGEDAASLTDPQSGPILGVLSQLKQEMEKDLKDTQKTESERASGYSELRKAKTAEIVGGEKSSEDKEDAKAKADIDLAGAKEDLEETQTTLEEDTKFEKSLKKTCAEADANFAKRKKSRMDEMTAVAEAVEILSEDEAKDAMSTTFKSFLQVSSEKGKGSLRKRAAKVLRRMAARSHSPELALLAGSVELDAFTKVKAAIDKMVETLTLQQSDEVKKNDWCKAELQSNDMATMKATDLKSDLEASAAERTSVIKKLEEDIAAAKGAISKEQTALQTATINRKKENLDFQKTIADQTLTIKVLEKALDRLATYYDEQALIQTREVRARAAQKPPGPEMKYKKSAGSTGVMSLMEKLIYDAKEIMAESRKNESEAQTSYEELVADSNGSIKSLQKSVVSKTDTRVEADKDLTGKTMDLKATTRDLDRLGKTDADLHKDCDYLLKNFMVRQQARSEEMEALKQSKSILSGAMA